MRQTSGASVGMLGRNGKGNTRQQDSYARSEQNCWNQRTRKDASHNSPLRREAWCHEGRARPVLLILVFFRRMNEENARS